VAWRSSIDSKKRRLRLWRRPVNLISQQDIREYWSAPQIEGGRRHIEDICPRDVRRHQIRSELNAVEAGIDNARKGFDGQRFRRSRHTFDQRMPLGQNSNQYLFDGVFLANDDLSSSFRICATVAETYSSMFIFWSAALYRRFSTSQTNPSGK